MPLGSLKNKEQEVAARTHGREEAEWGLPVGTEAVEVQDSGLTFMTGWAK